MNHDSGRGIIIPPPFLIGFQGIYNIWIQSLVSFGVLQRHGSGIMRQQAEPGEDSETRHFAALSSLRCGKALTAIVSVTDFGACLRHWGETKINCHFCIRVLHLCKVKSQVHTAECWLSHPQQITLRGRRTSAFMCGAHSNFTLADVVPYQISWRNEITDVITWRWTAKWGPVQSNYITSGWAARVRVCARL